MSDNERLLSTTEILKILNIPSYKLDYLFKSQKLESGDFLTLGTGQRIYRYGDIEKIKLALREIQSK